MGRFGRLTFGVLVGTALLGGMGAAVPATALAAGVATPGATAIEYGLSAPAGTHLICYPTAVEYAFSGGCR